MSETTMYRGIEYNTIFFQWLQINGLLLKVHDIAQARGRKQLNDINGINDLAVDTHTFSFYWADKQTKFIKYLWEERGAFKWKQGQRYITDCGLLLTYHSHTVFYLPNSTNVILNANGVCANNNIRIKAELDEADEWRWREEERLHNGLYLPITTNGIEFTPEHYIHWSVEAGEKLGKIAFTPSAEFGREDRQLVMKLGKYLRKYHSALLDHEIRDLVGKLTSFGTELVLCTTAEDIKEAYVDISCSCMGGDGYPLHPSIVYSGTPDVAVAYVPNVGRAVINLMDRTYYSMYGDESRMRPILEVNGYTRGEGLSGCTLSYHEHNDVPVMPYLDGETQVTLLHDEEGERYWMVGHIDSTPIGHTILDTHDASNTNGFIGDVGYCDACGEVSEDYVYLEYEEERRCSSCQDDLYSYNGDYFTEAGLEYNDLVLVAGDVYVMEDCVLDYYSDEYILEGDAIRVWYGGDVVYMSEYNAEQHCDTIPEQLQDDYEGCEYVY